MNSSISIEKLFADVIQQTNKHSCKLPPVHLWHPQKTGDIDLRIDREGRWLHESVEIKRSSMTSSPENILNPGFASSPLFRLDFSMRSLLFVKSFNA